MLPLKISATLDAPSDDLRRIEKAVVDAGNAYMLALSRDSNHEDCQIALGTAELGLRTALDYIRRLQSQLKHETALVDDLDSRLDLCRTTLTSVHALCAADVHISELVRVNEVLRLTNDALAALDETDPE